MGALAIRKYVIIAVILGGVAWGQSTSSPSIQELSPNQVSADEGSGDQPGTTQPAENGAENVVDPASLIPDLPSLPKAKASLIGGNIGHLDRVRDELTIRVFGGGHVKTLFDPRTHVLRDGKPISTEDLKPGERVYVDTILVNGQIFARNIRVSGSNPQGQGQGVVLSYHPENGDLLVRDLLSPKPMKLRVNSSSKILRNGQQASTRDLVPGTLLALRFEPEPHGESVAREISILITPGTQFTFSGRVSFLDLRTGLLVVTSSADHKPYEIHFDPSALQLNPNLHEGSEVTVLTRYDGNQYVARGLTVESNSPK
jgi:hypothetical protein